MPPAERLGARSRCWVAPVGADPNDKAAWTELPVSDAGIAPAFTADSSVLALQRRINDAWHNYSWPRRYVMGIDPATHFTFNERKPMGLSKQYSYKSTHGNGRELLVERSAFEDGGLHIQVRKGDDVEWAWVRKADTIPLALNVLGWDRPSAEYAAAGATTYNGRAANRPIPSSTGGRDANIAEAIDLLRGADIFDQRQAEREAKGAEAAKREAEAAALVKRDAEYAKHKQESFERAKQAYADAIGDQVASGISAESAAKVQAALSAYETARRKLEGLPS